MLIFEYKKNSEVLHELLKSSPTFGTKEYNYQEMVTFHSISARKTVDWHEFMRLVSDKHIF